MLLEREKRGKRGHVFCRCVQGGETKRGGRREFTDTSLSRDGSPVGEAVIGPQFSGREGGESANGNPEELIRGEGKGVLNIFTLRPN